MIKSARSVNRLPPSSSGLGRSPFKATTGVRIPVGAQEIAERRFLFNTTGVPIEEMVTSQNSENKKELIAGLRFEQRGKPESRKLVR